MQGCMSLPATAHLATRTTPRTTGSSSPSENPRHPTRMVEPARIRRTPGCAAALARPNSQRGVLDQPKTTTWSTVSVGGEDPFDGIWLRLTSTEPSTCRIAAAPDAVKAGLCTPAIPVRSPALVDDTSLAYLALRHLEPEGSAESRWELGAIGHGPTGWQLADRLCDRIRAWDQARTPQPVITAYPTRTRDDQLRHAINKRWTHLTVSC